MIEPMETNMMTSFKDKRTRQKVISVGEQLDPALARLGRRVYEAPASYPQALPDLRLSLASTVIGWAYKDSTPGLADEVAPYAAVQRLASQCDYPFTLVSATLVEALLRTKIPDRWDRRSAPLGFPGYFFLIPPGSLVGDYPEEVITVLGVGILEERNLLIVTALSPTSGRSWFSTISFGDDGVADLFSDRRFTPGVTSQHLGIEVDEQLAQQTIHRCVSLAVQLVFIRFTRPEYISGGTYVTTVKKTRREVWTVPTLGESFRVSRIKSPRGSEGGGNDRARPHEHWVSGHWKQVRSGQKWINFTSKWIAPYVRCPED